VKHAVAVAEPGRSGEVRDLGRFDRARQFMVCPGLVPGERSTGDTVRRPGIPKAGNGRIRRALVERAWTDRHPARGGKDEPYVHRRVPPRPWRHRRTHGPDVDTALFTADDRPAAGGSRLPIGRGQAGRMAAVEPIPAGVAAEIQSPSLFAGLSETSRARRT
jgi:hypothetical protein